MSRTPNLVNLPGLDSKCWCKSILPRRHVRISKPSPPPPVMSLLRFKIPASELVADIAGTARVSPRFHMSTCPFPALLKPGYVGCRILKYSRSVHLVVLCLELQSGPSLSHTSRTPICFARPQGRCRLEFRPPLCAVAFPVSERQDCCRNHTPGSRCCALPL